MMYVTMDEYRLIIQVEMRSQKKIYDPPENTEYIWYVQKLT